MPPKPKALVVIGDISTGSSAYTSTAMEAVSDFKRDGYDVIYLTTPSKATVLNWLKDKNTKAFCFVGHGSSGWSDSKDSCPLFSDNDMLSVNSKEMIHASDVYKARLGKGVMDTVILHACHQGRENTRSRWTTAFNAAKLYAAWGQVYTTTFWWQLAY